VEWIEDRRHGGRDELRTIKACLNVSRREPRGNLDGLVFSAQRWLRFFGNYMCNIWKVTRLYSTGERFFALRTALRNRHFDMRSFDRRQRYGRRDLVVILIVHLLGVVVLFTG